MVYMLPYEIKYSDSAITLSIMKNDVEWMRFYDTGINIYQQLNM